MKALSKRKMGAVQKVCDLQVTDNRESFNAIPDSVKRKLSGKEIGQLSELISQERERGRAQARSYMEMAKNSEKPARVPWYDRFLQKSKKAGGDAVVVAVLVVVGIGSYMRDIINRV